MSDASGATSAWELESQRLTIFRVPGVDFDVEGTWSLLAGHPPTDVSRKPALNSAKATGSFGAGQLVVQADPLRADCSYVGVVQEDKGPFPQALGNYAEVLSVFVDPIRRWLGQGVQVLRLAYGCALMQQVDSHVHAYRRLATFLPTMHIDPEHASDLQYQINRPRKSGIVDGLAINRLSKWAAKRVVINRYSGVSNEGQITSMLLSEVFQSNLELDINSASDWTDILPQDQLPDLLDEFVKLSLEIAIGGDIE